MIRLPLLAQFALGAILLFSVSARADICVYKDAEGNVTYSNVTEAPPKGAKKLRCFEEPKQPAQPASSEEARPSARKKQEGFPRVDGDTQRKRDDERRSILEQELASEQEALEKARSQLQEQESVRTGDERNYQRYLDRVQPYRETVANHERNIQAIQQELSNLR